jgi:hypothetical protein
LKGVARLQSQLAGQATAGGKRDRIDEGRLGREQEARERGGAPGEIGIDQDAIELRQRGLIWPLAPPAQADLAANNVAQGREGEAGAVLLARRRARQAVRGRRVIAAVVDAGLQKDTEPAPEIPGGAERRIAREEIARVVTDAAACEARHGREVELADGGTQLKGEPVEAVIEGDGGAIDFEVTALGRRERRVWRGAGVLLELVRDERLQIGARADVEAPARFQGVGPVVLARMPGEEGGSARGPKLQGVPAPVGNGAQVGAHLESRIGLPRRAPQHVVGGKPRNLRLRENDETGAAHAGRAKGSSRKSSAGRRSRRGSGSMQNI